MKLSRTLSFALLTAALTLPSFGWVNPLDYWRDPATKTNEFVELTVSHDPNDHGGPSHPEAWENAPMGIAITRFKANSYGLFCDFETDLPPPYYVGIYTIDELNFPLNRFFPFMEVETWNTKNVFIGCGLVQKDCACFLQVLSKSAKDSFTNKYGIARRELTPEEWKAHTDRLEAESGYIVSDPEFSLEFTRDRIDSLNQEGIIVSDNTWCMFSKTDETNFTFTITGRKWHPGVESIETNVVQDVEYDNWFYNYDGVNPDPVTATNLVGTFEGATGTVDYWDHTNITLYAGGPAYFKSITHYHYLHNDHYSYKTNYSKWFGRLIPESHTFSITNGTCDIGTGYRIVSFTDRNEVYVQRAYSTLTNMSDEVLLPRIHSAFTAHDEYKFTTDLYGRRYFQRETNAVPDKINWNGINRK